MIEHSYVQCVARCTKATAQVCEQADSLAANTSQQHMHAGQHFHRLVSKACGRMSHYLCPSPECSKMSTRSRTGTTKTIADSSGTTLAISTSTPRLCPCCAPCNELTRALQARGLGHSAKVQNSQICSPFMAGRLLPAGWSYSTGTP